LAEARQLAPGQTGRVISVFGCGGNRDRAKRPVMGAVAAAASDVAILTSDNPRDEDPFAIIEEVLAGIPGGRENPRVVVEADRRVAIRRGLDAAEAGDVVVVAGKGHETYQEIAGRRLPFDDAVEARDALAARFASDPSTWMAPAHESAAPTQADGPVSASASRGTSAEG
jgi:UDP-N-acetylmuramyl tripeptide synthase